VPHPGSSLPVLPAARVQAIVRRALEEDMPWADITTDALVPPDVHGVGRFIVKQPGTIAGLQVAAMVFDQLEPDLRFVPACLDGDFVQAGTVVAEVWGSVRPILGGERTALNLLQRMSGIATETRRYVEAVSDTGATITDTRKTAPGLRLLDKYAVRCGGGANHRFSLSDAVLVKDNHLAAFAEGRSGPDATTLPEALRAARRKIPHTMTIEVEVDRLDQIEEALSGGADIILLDNMEPEKLRSAVDLIGGRARTEASGGIDLETVRRVAETGVDLISVGALTHSIRALDIGLEVVVRP